MAQSSLLPLLANPTATLGLLLLDGANTITYTAKALEGGTGKEALAIRVYLMSELEGTQPIKAFEYRVDEGGTLTPFGTGAFTVDPETAAKLLPKSR